MLYFLCDGLCDVFISFSLVRAARTLLAKNLSFNITEDELKEVFEDAVEIRLVSQDGKSKGIAYIEFKSEADAEKNLEEKQGAEIDGRSVSLYYTGEKGQRQERGGKNSLEESNMQSALWFRK